jgi:hypothetical protein
LSLVRGTIAMLQNQLQGWEHAFGEAAPDQPEQLRPTQESSE